jgi:hypothetical protein
MKPDTFVPIVLLALCSWLAVPAAADIVVHGGGSTPVADASPGEEGGSPVVEADPAGSAVVPEPATFGLISLGLAVGAGLLVRNKRPGNR